LATSKTGENMVLEINNKPAHFFSLSEMQPFKHSIKQLVHYDGESE